ncbi:unnamed protein product [Rangifer tarandus platyrhynchus]|uniref:Uncharacterized protein n=2 Tax=Rangifer tarandus platyrhynchus TaxID=3082113 RepID=A0ABN8XWZ5_RANTA|nr:unnamed protein product [Rangifer tarandus platyrhynchus]CAI9691591.1 unnamed protein product [Rangifer tarandus platyrhynchus]
MRPSKPLSPKKPLQPYRGPTSRPGLQSSPGVHRGPLLSVQELKGGAKRPRSVTPDEKELPTSESENRRVNLASVFCLLGYSGLAPVRGRGLAATFHEPSRHSTANERS